MRPESWGDALTQNPLVEGPAVMVGSLGDEAQRLQQSLPQGRGHVVMDTGMLQETCYAQLT